MRRGVRKGARGRTQSGDVKHSRRINSDKLWNSLHTDESPRDSLHRYDLSREWYQDADLLVCEMYHKFGQCHSLQENRAKGILLIKEAQAPWLGTRSQALHGLLIVGKMRNGEPQNHQESRALREF
jgi:hypothetical protein